jgi:hypothetical protein
MDSIEIAGSKAKYHQRQLEALGHATPIFEHGLDRYYYYYSYCSNALVY